MSSQIDQIHYNVFYQLVSISTKIERYNQSDCSASLDENLNFQSCTAHSFLPYQAAENVSNHVLKAFPFDNIANKAILTQLRSKFKNFEYTLSNILTYIRKHNAFVRVIGVNSKVGRNTKRAIILLKAGLAETRKYQELQALLDAKKTDIAKLHIQILVARKFVLYQTQPLYKQLAMEKKAKDVAKRAGLFEIEPKKQNIESFWAYFPLEIMPSCKESYSPALLKLNKELQLATSTWYSSLGDKNRDMLVKALNECTSSIELSGRDIQLAKQMVNAHFLHANAFALYASQDMNTQVTSLISQFERISSYSKAEISCDYLKSHAVKMLRNLLILFTLFPKATSDCFSKDSIGNITHHIAQVWQFVGGFDEKKFNVLVTSLKSKNSKSYQINFLDLAKSFRESFLQKYSFPDVLKHLDRFASFEFAAISKKAFSLLPLATQNSLNQSVTLDQHLNGISDIYDVYLKSETELNDTFDFTPEFKKPAPQIKLIEIPIASPIKFEEAAAEDSLAAQFGEMSLKASVEVEIEEIPSLFVKNNFYSITSPRVARWFHPFATSIFETDASYANLSKNRYFEMIVRHAFSKAVDRYVQTHFIEIQSKTAVGPCTLFIAKGLIQIDDQEFDGFFEYVVTPEGELIHRYFSDPKDTRSHRRADELLDNFFYDELPEELQGEWSVVGLKAKEQETKDYVVISEEFTVNQIKKNISIYIHK